MEDDRLISEQEFADMMGWKLSYARKVRYDGDAPPFVQNGKGGTVRYWLGDVRQWVRERTHDGELTTADGESTETADA